MNEQQSSADFLERRRKQVAPEFRGNTPPHSVEAEQGALSSMMRDRNVLAQGVDRLTTEHFFLPQHETVFAALCELYRANKGIDFITLSEFLREQKLLESVGGPAYITELGTFVPTSANAQYYFDILREKYLGRVIIARCTELVRAAYDNGSEIGQVLEQTQATLTEIIMEAERPETCRHIKEGIAAVLDELEHVYHNRGKQGVRGLATGFFDFDRMTGGLLGQQFMIIGARPGQGKTAMALNMAANMAVKNKVPVGVFSMEMSFREISERLFAAQSGMDLQRFRDGMLPKWQKFQMGATEHAGKLMSAPLWVDDTPALLLSSFRARARLMKVRLGVKAIIVDYLQLMRCPIKGREDQRWLEVTRITGGLKAIAKELNIPVIACAQLNRDPEKREFSKPGLSDLRESGSLEQDADIVALLWRPAPKAVSEDTANKISKVLGLKDEDGNVLWETVSRKKGKDGETVTRALTPSQKEERKLQLKQYAAFLVVKHRNGPVNDLRLRFTGEQTRFDDVTEKMWSNREDERQEMGEES